MKFIRIAAFVISVLAVISLVSCGERDTEPQDGTTVGDETTAAIVYESVKASFESADSAEVTIEGEPGASVAGRAGTRSGGDGEWSYTEYTATVGEDGVVSFTVTIPEGAKELEVIIDRATAKDSGTEIDAKIASVVPNEEKPLIPAPLKNMSSTLPSVGDVKVLVFFVEFPDKEFRPQAYNAERMETELFGEGKAEFPYESVTAWFERASYGNLHMTGDVYYYKCKNPLSYYEKGNYEEFAMEVLSGLDDEIDYSEYDSDGDRIIDNISFTVPLDGADQTRLDYWYGKTMTWYENPSYRIDRMGISQYIIMDVMPYTSSMPYLKQTLIHEMGHCMGLPDYYKYDSADWEGLHGSAGLERMDDSLGDFCAFSKLMLGWFREDEVQVYDGEGEKTFYLRSSSNEADCIILPISNSLNGYKSEYFIIEYVTDENNNYDLTNYASSKRERSGIRVFHVQAETAVMSWGSTEFKYNNFSQYYKGDDKIRVLALVNDGKPFYRTGGKIEFGEPNFAGYDRKGTASVDTGYVIEIGELNDGSYTVKVTK